MCGFGFFFPYLVKFCSPLHHMVDFTGGVGDHLTCNLKDIRCLLSNVAHRYIQEGATKRRLIKYNTCLQDKETREKLSYVTQARGALLLEPSARRHPTAPAQPSLVLLCLNAVFAPRRWQRVLLHLSSGLCQGSWSQASSVREHDCSQSAAADFASSLFITPWGYV